MRGLLSAEGEGSSVAFRPPVRWSPVDVLMARRFGVTHEIHQGQGGEQGDAPMSALFKLGQHPALVAVQRHLGPNERLLAFLDDIDANAVRTRRSPFSTCSVVSCGTTHASRSIWARGKSGACWV